MNGRQRRNLWVGAGSALTVVMVILASVYLWGWFGERTLVEQQSFDQPVRHVDLDLSNGDVTFLAATDHRILVKRTLTWAYDKPVTNDRGSADAVTLSASCGDHLRLPGCRIHYEVTVPAGVTINATVRSGAIASRGNNGTKTFQTTSGDIDVRDGQGDLSAQATSGAVVALRLDAPNATVTAKSGNVRLSFSTAPDSVRASTTSGDLSISVPPADAYRVQGSTLSGSRSIDVTQDAAAPRSITADARSGDTRVGYAQP
ncbi:DUF4097 family beta strand repeat-containing protein [Actinoplanes sp. L3-i22]|uniref:DUF4097 family beta strand repeat-containing protein n=1 Tax=Actinoplanes sp. L3-i22 TaxID=2836373 RepID=UPI001C772A74|nr:DUF4097 family beta strand repeat-containing protein [Actinoplanes sp. L3-i22]BCY08716.1 hypothetical protein L3i22_038040 [Actinoplanes sp. L3-i22]